MARIWFNMRPFTRGKDGKVQRPPKGYKNPEVISRYEAKDEIYEDKYEQDADKFNAIRDEIMTEEQKKRADFYLQHYYTLVAEMDGRKEEWEELERLYGADIDDPENEDDPNIFVPIINPSIEGQIQTLDVDPQPTIKGQGFSDHQFAHTAEILTTWCFKQNKIRKLIKRHERRRRGYIGTAWFKVVWDPDALDGFGMPKITCPSPTKVFVDGKIKDYMRLQEADFIIEEIGLVSIMELRRDKTREPINGKTMDEIADAIALGNSVVDFGGEESGDDQDSFTLLHIWTRNNEYGNLQLIEMSKCGIIISESDPKEPYYTMVRNQYPYFITVLYERENSLYGFSDGKLLKRLQILMNNLWNECVIACRHSAQTATFVDPSSGIDPDEFAAGKRDPRHPIPAKNPNVTIKESQGKGLNMVIFQLIGLVIQEAQRVIRFSSLKTGTNTGRIMTARQASIEMAEAERGMDDKKTDLSDTLADVAEYCLCLMMENWDAAKAFRVSENDDFEWIDARELANIPVLVPADQSYLDSWRAEREARIAAGLEKRGEVPEPKFMQLYKDEEEKDPETGEPIYEVDKKTGEKRKKTKRVPVTKQVEFDIDVSIGEGLPTNKIALYNIILTLANLRVPDEETGMPRPILTYEKVKKMLGDLLGLDIDDETPRSNPQEEQFMRMIRSIMSQQAQPGQNMSRPNLMRAQIPQQVTANESIPGETIGGYPSNAV